MRWGGSGLAGTPVGLCDWVCVVVQAPDEQRADSEGLSGVHMHKSAAWGWRDIATAQAGGGSAGAQAHERCLGLEEERDIAAAHAHEWAGRGSGTRSTDSVGLSGTLALVGPEEKMELFLRGCLDTPR